MFKVFTVSILTKLDLLAATPKFYKALGDPIYHEIPAVQKTVKISYFKKNTKLLEDFVHEASSHQKLGFVYDKKRHNNTRTNKNLFFSLKIK